MLKLSIFNVLYQEGDVNLIVDTNVKEVTIPPYLYGRMTNFIVGNNSAPTLKTDKKGISAPMRFGGTRFTCYFPWQSIRAMVAKKAVVNFPADGEEDQKEKTRKGAPSLKVVK